MGSDRRLGARLPVRVALRIRRSDLFETVQTADLALDGLFLETDAPHRQDQLLHLELPERPSPNLLRALVSRVVEPEGGRLGGLGLRLYGLGRRARRHWLAFFEAQQAALLAEVADRAERRPQIRAGGPAGRVLHRSPPLLLRHRLAGVRGGRVVVLEAVNRGAFSFSMNEPEGDGEGVLALVHQADRSELHLPCRLEAGASGTTRAVLAGPREAHLRLVERFVGGAPPLRREELTELDDEALLLFEAPEEAQPDLDEGSRMVEVAALWPSHLDRQG